MADDNSSSLSSSRSLSDSGADLLEGHAAPQSSVHRMNGLWGLTLVDPASCSGSGESATMIVCSSSSSISESPSFPSFRSAVDRTSSSSNLWMPRAAAVFAALAVSEDRFQS